MEKTINHKIMNHIIFVPDPHEKDYQTVRVDKSLCGSCDANAECGCNLLSGEYRCVCPLGFYGTGGHDPDKPTCTSRHLQYFVL